MVCCYNNLSLLKYNKKAMLRKDDKMEEAPFLELYVQEEK